MFRIEPITTRTATSQAVSEHIEVFYTYGVWTASWSNENGPQHIAAALGS